MAMNYHFTQYSLGRNIYTSLSLLSCCVYVCLFVLRWCLIESLENIPIFIMIWPSFVLELARLTAVLRGIWDLRNQSTLLNIFYLLRHSATVFCRTQQRHITWSYGGLKSCMLISMYNLLNFFVLICTGLVHTQCSWVPFHWLLM